MMVVFSDVFVLAQLSGEPHPASIFELFLEAGPMAKFVFAVLAGMSLASWAIMLGKFFQFRKIASETRHFLDV
ncbi:MAG: hypothetical protein OEM62_13325, partial [Acidobacteriota bacterium]|nr:hypothetical protein [Acidobacteriota bacterium]